MHSLAEPTDRLILAARLPISRQAVVKHLGVLEAAGLVAGARSGREMRFTVRPAALDETARWLADRAAAWDRRLARIKRIAEAGNETNPPKPNQQGDT